MNAHVLFSDGTSAELRVELDASAEPKVFLLGSASREVLSSAELGANAAYFSLRRRGLVRRPYTTFFEVAAAPTMLGESAGLCFALAFAAHALAREHTHARPVAFAATGTLASGAIHADVGPVDAIAAKVGSGVALLAPGSMLFVPAAHEADLPAAVRDAAASKGVRLVAVATVDDAVATLAAAVLGSASSRRPTMRSVVAAAAALALVVLGWASVRYAAAARGERAARAARAGEFATLAGKDDLLAWLPGGDARLATLTGAARRELTLLLALHSRADGAVTDDAGDLPALGPDDRYRVSIEPSRDCYLYAVQVDSWGTATVLFPNPAFSAETNPMHGDARHWVPDGDRWLALDRQPGKETIVIVAAPWPADDLETLFGRLADANGDTAAVVEAIRQRAALRKAARLAGLRGIAYEEIVFAHR